MGNIFSKPKVTKIAPPKPTPPPPVETAAQAGEEIKRRPASGREATFLTGDLVPEKKKKDKLG